jgi:hypothetical protein
MKNPTNKNCTIPLFLCSFLMCISHDGFANIDTKHAKKSPKNRKEKMRGRISPMNLERGKQISST